jgi:hypothetical protein
MSFLFPSRPVDVSPDRHMTHSNVARAMALSLIKFNIFSSHERFGLMVKIATCAAMRALVAVAASEQRPAFITNGMIQGDRTKPAFATLEAIASRDEDPATRRQLEDAMTEYIHIRAVARPGSLGMTVRGKDTSILPSS